VSKPTRDTKGGRPAAPGTAKARSPLSLILAGVVVVVVLVVGWNLFSSATDKTVRAPITLPELSAEELLALALPAEFGSEDTPILVMDFSDYSCPSCAQFSGRVKPILDVAYFEAGLVRFQYFDFPLVGVFPNSFTAARAARCAGDQGQYWPFHDRLFIMQPNWSGLADPVPSFEQYARDLGLDAGAFRSCLRSDRHADVVTANLRLGEQLRVGGTPTIFLNAGDGRPQRIQNWGDVQQVRALLDEAIERRGVRPAGSGGATDAPEAGDAAGETGEGTEGGDA
jgi:protein-disulfide isomerase